MKSKIVREFPCSFFELYSICGTAIGNLLLFLTDFAGFRKVYDADYAAKLQKLLDDSKALPDGQQGYASAEILYGKMKAAGPVCLRKFRMLKRYIINAYSDPTEQKTNTETAGGIAYKDARNGNWESMSGMNSAMLKFIADHKTELEANDNMPDTFIAEAGNAVSDFETAYGDYKLAEQTGNITAAKVASSNKLYKEVMNMLQDGQVIFEENPELAERFVFTRLWDLITIQNTGVKLRVKSVPDNMPVSYAQVSIQKAGEPAEVLDANEDGELERKIAAGAVTLVVSAEGKIPQTLMVNLVSGSYKSIEVELKDAA